MTNLYNSSIKVNRTIGGGLIPFLYWEKLVSDCGATNLSPVVYTTPGGEGTNVNTLLQGRRTARLCRISNNF